MASVKNSQADYPAALADFEKAVDLLQRCGNKTGLAFALGNMAVVYNSISDFPKALDCLEKAIAINEKMGNHFALAAELITRGNVANNLSNYVSALDYFQKALNIYERIGYKPGLANAYGSIGYIYNNFSNPAKALEYLQKSLSIQIEVGDTIRTAGGFLDIAGIYGTAKNYTKALGYYKQAQDIYEAKGIKRALPALFNNMGFAFYNLGDYGKVFKYYQTGLNIAEQLGQKRIVSLILLSIGEFYRDAPDSVIVKTGVNPVHRYDTVAAYLNAGNKIAKELGVINWQRYAWEDLSMMYERQGEFAKALEAYKNFILLRDSIINDQKEKKISHLAMQYEFDRKADSVKLEERITDEKLKQQVLLAKQQQQQLELGRQELALITQEKDLQKTAYLKTQAELQNEQLQKREKEKLLIIAEKEKKLQQASAAQERYSNRVSIYGLIALLGFLFLIAVLLWYNNLQKQKANALLVRQEHETGLQKQKAEKALDELKCTQNQLVQSEKMASLGELTAGIAHEIQNPLNFVNNFSEVNCELIEELTGEITKGNTEQIMQIADDIKQNMQKINQHGKRADGIVKAMLQHSRTATGKRELTDINALANEYLRLSFQGFRAKDKGFNATIETSFDETLPKINITAQDIARVMLNLFNNAFYAVAEKGRRLVTGYSPAIFVSTKKIHSPSGHTGIELRVRDNGMGIPIEIIDKIFQPFYTTKPAGQGTGLGLSLSYDIITKGHGGHLKAETKEGEYAEFIIELPVK